MSRAAPPINRQNAGRVDLHAHTTASDGHDSPTQLVHLALERKLVALGITDHDSMAGVREATRAAQGTGLTLFPGVEFNTDVPGREVHVIGYFADPQVPLLREKLALLQGGRKERARRILSKLEQLGISLTWDSVTAQAEGAIGRPHIARALLEAGHVESVQEAFDRFIAKGCPAYVEHLRVTPEGAVKMTVEGGGVPVLAHPMGVLDYLEPLIAVGLQGLEVYYPSHTPEDVESLRRLADRYHLIPTGGTDHHGYPRVDNIGLGDLKVPLDSVRQLQAACDSALARYRERQEQDAGPA